MMQIKTKRSPARESYVFNIHENICQVMRVHRTQWGEYRVTFREDVLDMAARACGVPVLTSRGERIERLEAVAAYESNRKDALELAVAMVDLLLEHPASVLPQGEVCRVILPGAGETLARYLSTYVDNA